MCTISSYKVVMYLCNVAIIVPEVISGRIPSTHVELWQLLSWRYAHRMNQPIKGWHVKKYSNIFSVKLYSIQ